MVTAASSYEYLVVSSRRTPCLFNTYYFLAAQYINNRTLLVGYEKDTPFNHAQTVCLRYEERMSDFLQTRPALLGEALGVIEILNSNKMCDVVFKGNNTKIENCLTAENGMLKNGL